MGDRKKSCGYCMVELQDMTDPRQLPCGHVFCIGCLKEDHKGLQDHRCATCRMLYGPINVDSLPSPANVEIDDKIEKLKCDRCHNKLATKYCMDCGQKICAGHYKHHEGYYDDLHETVDITEYEQNIDEYSQVMTCEDHGKVITMACKRCFKYNCIECHEDMDCNRKEPCVGHYVRSSSRYGVTPQSYTQAYTQAYDTVQDHTYYPLKKIKADIKSNFQNLLQKTSAKLTSISDTEKRAYLRMDNLVEECKKMKAEVKVKTEEQIQLIQDQSEGLIERIDSYQSETTEQLMSIIENNTTRQEHILEVKRKTNKLCQGNVSQLVEGREQVLEDITEANDTNIDPVPSTYKGIRIGKKRKMEIELETSYNTSQIRYDISNNGFFPTTENWAE